MHLTTCGNVRQPWQQRPKVAMSACVDCEAAMNALNPTTPAFAAPFAPDDAAAARELLAHAALDPLREARVDALAGRLIAAIRAQGGGLGGVEDVLRAYSLSTKEGLALMVLAEALLRVPDGATADRLIEDKLGKADFAHHEPRSDAFLVNASAWALGLTARVIQPGETPDGIMANLAKRIGLPAVRAATRQAMRVMGSHFVLGETIEDALRRASAGTGRAYRYSFDMLGEGARTQEDADRYLESYAAAIEAIGKAAGNDALPNRPGISVKLSALHPRYEAFSRKRVLDELTPRALQLAQAAKRHDLNFTVDAEEADRLELSLDVIATVAADPSLAGWDGFGLAIQAYQKRATAVIDFIEGLAKAHGRRMMVRLVKGAYWDTEVKRAQERGLDDYPVWTRKAMTDLNFMACAERMLQARPLIYPQFATHNALTVASIIERAGGVEGYEFQRLHGMGEALYARLIEEMPAACRVYAPVGGHRDLLAYLVRRLIENGANASFVSQAGDPEVPADTLLKRPAALIGTPERARHRHVPLPAALYGASRANSRGVEFGHAAALESLLAEIASAGLGPARAAPVLNGTARVSSTQTPVLSPIDGQAIGVVVEATPDLAGEAMRRAAVGFQTWSQLPVSARAAALARAADLMEERRGRLLALLQAEAGKTLDDALAEVREAIDFCRYYAAEARRTLAEDEVFPGPTGEDNRLRQRGRGVFVCISPWNFPLAIFTGQVAAALVAGNAVVAKPAEQTPLIAMEAVTILHAAGVPGDALHLLPGDGAVGAALVESPLTAGVAFTGSTATAQAINRALAAKTGPIVPLIAETGGINAMIVDATALPEQVVDDVVTSAYRSAGQRCSALRLLCVQTDVAPKIISMIVGAARELKIGDPRDVSVQIGPVIDADAMQRLNSHADHMAKVAREHRIERPDPMPATGTYVRPRLFELNAVSELKEEVFGPILHVVRYKAGALDQTVRDIANLGFGLTLGIHSRIDETADRIISRLVIGNVYVNRNMIGAVVGTQPFGGSGLSGTGPKAGGPHYLRRFVTEQVVTVNTAAAGGNAGLIAMGEGWDDL
jgi:RHH-type proline utilization regulon transcriptional repressor/proline dehydrogenase/delta 1-pyrroline-5-carboxylate dehydrogenase